MPYDICIYRSGRNCGTLVYTGNKVKYLEAACLFDPTNTVGPGTFPNCSATIMATRQKPGILVKWRVFIHEGTKPEHTKGCYVIAGALFMKIWNDIPIDAHNVTVTIVDRAYMRPREQSDNAAGPR
jgi:hypothetical protein